MNVVDSEVVVAILQKQEYEVTEKVEEADLVLVNTCSIRDNAEQKVNQRIQEFGHQKKLNSGLTVGVIGCMAERLKEKLLEEDRSVDLVVGPDAYRDLPSLLKEVENGQKGINTLLWEEETYSDINPVRLDRNHVSSFVAIMRGCNNFCAFCVVPFTRGRERSRDPKTIEQEVLELYKSGYKEVTLLGQNVNSYRWHYDSSKNHLEKPTSGPINIAEVKPSDLKSLKFEDLLDRVAQIAPDLRIRYTSPHPKDISEDVLKVMAKHQNICRSVHLPLQSGSTSVLKRMKRGYSREMYMEKIEMIRKYLPEASVSTDIIAGFCGETEEEHQDTLFMMKWASYDFAYMFKYSERPDTYAARKLADDVPEEVKSRRLNEIIHLQSELSLKSKKQDIGKSFEVLVEGTSKKSVQELTGRTSQNKVVVFPAEGHKPGDYVNVKIHDCTSATLKGRIVT